MFEVFNYLRNSGMGCCIFHSGLTQKEKIQTMENFRRGIIKRIISTVALGMGLDFDNLDCVIHINMTKSVENYIQETGRAGRREKRAYCHLFLDPYDYFTERNYLLAD
jgi:superfamily II DNA helicase RecQ